MPGDTRENVALDSVDFAEVRDAFEKAGHSHGEATELGRLARRSALALRRRLAVRPGLHRPGWVDAGSATIQRRALLLNSWSDHSEGDREVVARVLGQDYGSVLDELVRMGARDGDPMVAVIDGQWHLVSPMDSVQSGHVSVPPAATNADTM